MTLDRYIIVSVTSYFVADSADCILAEYTEHPGRVFLESQREIKAGEESSVIFSEISDSFSFRLLRS